MKRSIYRSVRLEIIVYGILSFVLTIITEGIIGSLLYMIGSALGISNGGYGKIRRPYGGYIPNKMSGAAIPNYHALRHWNKSTIVSILLVMLFFGFLFFMMYFLFFTRRITRDMTYISKKILEIASGDMKEDIRIDIDREDELGEIAHQVGRMSKEIKRLMKSERETLQANKDMITCVAHDLRTPLTSIIGYLQLATEREKYSVDERQKYAHIAMRKAERMQGLIEELFSYTKLMSGEITLHRDNIDIVKLVEQLVEEYYPLFMENELECTLSSNIDGLTIYADGELMARAVQNLISNAIKYGKDGKSVEIETRLSDDIFTICVTNYGVVIPKESLNHIFDKFYRVEDSRSTQTGGTGLGLNIAQEIIVLHGGNIEVASDMNGTRFMIELPLDELQEEKESEY